MNKKFLIIGGMVGFLLILGVAILLVSQKSSFLLSPIVSDEKAVGEEAVKLMTWEDPAGFSFTYPENIEIDPHEEDEENYAHLELTSSSHSGRIIIWVKDNNYTDIEKWASQEATEGGQIFDTELGGEPAKKIAYVEPAKLVTVTIDVDALVLIEMIPDGEGYWQEVYDQVIDSFAFIPLEGEPAFAGASAGKEAVAPGPWEGGGGAGGIIEEAEEVIE